MTEPHNSRGLKDFEVERGNGSKGRHLFHPLKSGVGGFSVDIVRGGVTPNAYASFVSPPRFPMMVDRAGKSYINSNPSRPIPYEEILKAVEEGRTGRRSWEMIGGGVEATEDLRGKDDAELTDDDRDFMERSSMLQEFKEEGGITVPSLNSLEPLLDMFAGVATDYRNIKRYSTTDFDFNPSAQQLESSEGGTEIKFINMKNLPAMINSKLITEAATIASIYKVMLDKRFRQFTD